MKKTKKAFFGILILTLLIFAVLFSSTTLAATCSPVGQEKTFYYENNCGYRIDICKYYSCPAGSYCIIKGYQWALKSCVPGEGVCCDPLCGYASPGQPCAPCKTCGSQGSCIVNLVNGTICKENGRGGYCKAGICEFDTVFPSFINNQEDIHLKGGENLSEIAFDFDFFDDLGLGKFEIKICNELGKCKEEARPIEGKSHVDDWKLSDEMIGWIAEQGTGFLNVDITVSDAVGNQNKSIAPFSVIKDSTAPEIDFIYHFPISAFTEETVTINITATDETSGIKAIRIYVDDSELIPEIPCVSSPCTKSISYGTPGDHLYYATVEDNAGNVVTSSVGEFTIEGKEEDTCSAQTGGQGKICRAGEYCQDGMFIFSSDSVEGRCCTSGVCAVEIILPNCEEQGGKIYDPFTQECGGADIPASDVLEQNKCCYPGSSLVSIKIEELEVYWTDSAGNRLAAVALGEAAICIATIPAEESAGKTAKFVIYRGGEEKKREEVMFEKGIAEISFILDELKTYRCEVTVDSTKADSYLEVIEAPAMPLREKLPGFGFIQLIIVICLILAYYIFVNMRKNEKEERKEGREKRRKK